MWISTKVGPLTSDRTFAAAGEEILGALRTAFAELIDHAVDRLTTVPDEKPETFRDSMIDNIRTFIETFYDRNLFDDEALNELVEKARLVVDGVSPRKLRKSADVREKTLAKFQEVKATLDGLVTERKSRRFNFEE